MKNKSVFIATVLVVLSLVSFDGIRAALADEVFSSSYEYSPCVGTGYSEESEAKINCKTAYAFCDFLGYAKTKADPDYRNGRGMCVMKASYRGSNRKSFSGYASRCSGGGLLQRGDLPGVLAYQNELARPWIRGVPGGKYRVDVGQRNAAGGCQVSTTIWVDDGLTPAEAVPVSPVQYDAPQNSSVGSTESDSQAPSYNNQGGSG